jgi:hypothetical protein
MFRYSRQREPLHVPSKPSERHGALAVSDLVRILLSHNDLVRLQLMAPNRGGIIKKKKLHRTELYYPR